MMENVFKYAIASLLILPMLFMFVVGIFSVILVISDLPLPNRDR